jgi:hypothetical protein
MPINLDHFSQTAAYQIWKSPTRPVCKLQKFGNKLKGVAMRKQRLLLATLIFSVSGWVSASVPIIKLVESQRAEVNFYSLLVSNNYFFGIKDSIKLAGPGADNGMHDLQSAPVSHKPFGVFSGILKQVRNTWTLPDHQVSEGSFSSYASETSSSYIAPVPDAGPLRAERHYGLMVASTPGLKSWAVLLLALGCVIYQGRRRQHPFGFQKLE